MRTSFTDVDFRFCSPDWISSRTAAPVLDLLRPGHLPRLGSGRPIVGRNRIVHCGQILGAVTTIATGLVRQPHSVIKVGVS